MKINTNNEKYVEVDTKTFCDIEMKIISNIKPQSNINIDNGDVIVLKLNSNKYKKEDGQAIFDVVKKSFPQNKVVLLFDADIEVERVCTND